MKRGRERERGGSGRNRGRGGNIGAERSEMRALRPRRFLRLAPSLPRAASASASASSSWPSSLPAKAAPAPYTQHPKPDSAARSSLPSALVWRSTATRPRLARPMLRPVNDATP